MQAIVKGPKRYELCSNFGTHLEKFRADVFSCTDSRGRTLDDLQILTSSPLEIRGCQSFIWTRLGHSKWIKTEENEFLECSPTRQFWEQQNSRQSYGSKTKNCWNEPQIFENHTIFYLIPIMSQLSAK